MSKTFWKKLREVQEEEFWAEVEAENIYALQTEKLAAAWRAYLEKHPEYLPAKMGWWQEKLEEWIDLGIDPPGE